MQTKQVERTAKIADDIRTIAPTVAQPAPFRVTRTKRDRVNDPSVMVANPDASDVFITETDPSSSHSQVMVGSLGMRAEAVLYFNMSKGNPTEFDHTVECGEPAGVCRNVDGDTNVDMTDVMAIGMTL